MNDKLAEELLAHHLEWDDQTAQEEIKFLQMLSQIKYDRYQNFEPGMRFIASLAEWLSQFATLEERRTAYSFIKNHLVFISSDEINQLIDLAFPERIFPIVLNQVASIVNKPSYLVKSISESKEFQSQLRRSLFLGLSDGARLDVLRRRALLNNEQVSVNYELSDEKCVSFKTDLDKWIADKKESVAGNFVNLFLVDDFSGSGTSILRLEKGHVKGKLSKVKNLAENCSLGSVMAEDAEIYLLLYIATTQSIEYLESTLKTLEEDPFYKRVKVIPPLQLLYFEYKSIIDQFDCFPQIIDKYYDDRVRDKHTDIGGTKDVKYGYAGCSLPFVIEHNTPNNSIALLWASIDPNCHSMKNNPGMKGLFPRISRHREDRP